MKNNFQFFILIFICSIFFLNDREKVSAQSGPGNSGGDALWHLPKFGEDGWFIHAHNGNVRVCNMDKASVIGNKQGPKCSNWQ